MVIWVWQSSRSVWEHGTFPEQWRLVATYGGSCCWPGSLSPDTGTDEPEIWKIRAKYSHRFTWTSGWLLIHSFGLKRMWSNSCLRRGTPAGQRSRNLAIPMMHCTTFMVRWAEDEDCSAWAMIRKPFEWNSCCWLVWDEETSREIKDNRVGLKFTYDVHLLRIENSDFRKKKKHLPNVINI